MKPLLKQVLNQFAKFDELVYQNPRKAIVFGIVFLSTVSTVVYSLDLAYSKILFQGVIVVLPVLLLVPVFVLRFIYTNSLAETIQGIESTKTSKRTHQEEQFTRLYQQSILYSVLSVVIASCMITIVFVGVKINSLYIIPILVSLLVGELIVTLFSVLYGIVIANQTIDLGIGR